ncbi:MAG: PAS domain-containing protein [Deltaproteobacteria bacterium]|nr:PAS domain-containing protein [Deltaproteobacteria bacterium]
MHEIPRQTLEHFFQQAPLAVAMVTGEDHRFAYANPAFLRFQDLKEPVAGKTVSEVFPNFADKSRQILNQVFSTGKPVSVRSHPAKVSSGKESYWDVDFMPFRDKGNVAGVLVLAKDVTDKALAEKEALGLAERERDNRLKRIEALFSATIRMLAENTVSGLMETMVEAALEITGARAGISGHGRAGRNFLAAVCSRDGRIPARILSMGAGDIFDELFGESQSIRLTDDKLRRWPVLEKLPQTHPPLRGLLGARLTTVEGSPGGMILVTDKEEGQDFTARDEARLRQLAAVASLGMRHVEAQAELLEKQKDLERAREELKEKVTQSGVELSETKQDLTFQKEALKKIVDNIPVMILFCDANGICELANQAFTETTGLSIADLREKGLLKRAFPRQDTRDRFRNFMLKGDPVWEDFPLHTANQEIITSWTSSRLTDGSYILFGRDVTPGKMAEEKLKAYAQELEWSNKELEDFAFVASHDLQEPLRKIRSFGDRLRSRIREEDPTAADYIERMDSAARRMQQLISSLLNYSRVTTRAKPFSPVSLDQILKEAVSNLEVRIHQTHGVVELEGTFPMLEADASQMIQLFQNLLGNALKFHKPGVPPRVVVSCEKTRIKTGGKARGENAVCVRVTDNGIGFDQKYKDKIFVPFQRLHGRSAYEGTGIGLSICRKIVDRHGGFIRAESEPGKGASFIVTLPMHHPKKNEVPPVSSTQKTLFPR